MYGLKLFKGHLHPLPMLPMPGFYSNPIPAVPEVKAVNLFSVRKISCLIFLLLIGAALLFANRTLAQSLPQARLYLYILIDRTVTGTFIPRVITATESGDVRFIISR
ncbi:hypothetical protein SAMN04488121_108116 [Chitinophaga filiformis]|uniref:Uncharacterized protein n=1 Tax=Chitinophaga filiformis TaxID=104663 RepID=A0A1G7Z3B1_CHIFI|nr:hypothetical protein SAMN04488121_108116 [Chitinophaga filiformis]